MINMAQHNSSINLFHITVILVVLNAGMALKCFTCTSPFGGYCDDISEKNPPKVEECSNLVLPTCYQLVHNVDAIKGQSAFVKRGCMEGSTCNTTKPQEPVNRFCYSCNINLCNNVTLYHKDTEDDDHGNKSNIQPSIVVLVTCLLMYVLEF
ncbi:hypothetical protein ILUMI_17359 [Ignelater luminosus]|uniref:Protein quiver n=1 Tax=Ignelater luminosus TaxID=2038154 RepID=A0A8K0CLV1_IGNLU|nr:hypothetical protein ILUMI_17359 [Ignelater luminosus]